MTISKKPPNIYKLLESTNLARWLDLRYQGTEQFLKVQNTEVKKNNDLSY